MPQVICLKRNSSNIPYGFKMQGGADFSIPLSVLQVTACSVADQAGLKGLNFNLQAYILELIYVLLSLKKFYRTVQSKLK